MKIARVQSYKNKPTYSVRLDEQMPDEGFVEKVEVDWIKENGKWFLQRRLIQSGAVESVISEEHEVVGGGESGTGNSV